MVKDIVVIAKMMPEKVIPLSIIWEDDRIFNIDKIIDVKKRSSTKGGGMGTRYEVRIKDKIRFLFLDEYRWFVEMPENM